MSLVSADPLVFIKYHLGIFLSHPQFYFTWTGHDDLPRRVPTGYSTLDLHDEAIDLH